MVDRMLLNTVGMSLVFLTRKPFPGRLCVTLNRTQISRRLIKMAGVAYQGASAPSPIQINAEWTFGFRFMARMISSGVI